jgi:pilus assembly protein CpaB
MLQGKYPLLIALVLALFAGVIAYSAIKAREKAVREGWAVKRILCAAQDVSEGSELDEEMVTTCEIPEKFATDSFIVIPEGAEVASELPYGQKVLVPLKRGDPVLFSHFESQRDFTLSEAIPLKMRAIAIEVQEKASVNQWIRPNDHVDIIGTFRDPESRELVAVTLLQNVIVLATGRISGMTPIVSEEEKRYQQIVLMTLPEEAEIITLASESGNLTLTLRNPKDLESEDQAKRKKKTDNKTLLTGDQSDALLKERGKYQGGVEVIHGRDRKREGAAGIPVVGD